MPATDSWRARTPQAGAATQLAIALQDDKPFEVDVSFYRVSRDEFVM